MNRAIEKNIQELTDEMDDPWLFGYLYYPVNWEYIHKELMKKNVTLQLLHREYEDKARNSKKMPYSYTSFCRGYRSYAHKYKLTMPIKRKPGELVEVDWVGSTLKVIDCETGNEEKSTSH
ncbi:hypothetical protein ACTHQT_19085 [Cytobacillus praedii]